MTDEKMREEFEVWASERLGLSTRKLSSGLYQSFGMHAAWEAWQASRAAIEVELLPRVTSEEVAEHLGIDDDTALDISHMINGAIIACGGMIKAAGLKVKP